jgi:hypothetical protein
LDAVSKANSIQNCHQIEYTYDVRKGKWGLKGKCRRRLPLAGGSHLTIQRSRRPGADKKVARLPHSRGGRRPQRKWRKWEGWRRQNFWVAPKNSPGLPSPTAMEKEGSASQQQNRKLPSPQWRRNSRQLALAVLAAGCQTASLAALIECQTANSGCKVLLWQRLLLLAELPTFVGRIIVSNQILATKIGIHL